MCGFYGNFTTKKNFKIKKKLSISLAHRGPDEEKEFLDEKIYMKFFRLKILGNNQSSQPMKSFDGRWIVMLNGEIYNYIEIANELQKNNLIKFGDTRVLTELIAERGLRSINKLNGMFAIIAYNKITKKIYFVRDRFGIKPLYYSNTNDEVFFASEIKSISKVLSPNISKQAIEEYFVSELYPESPKTFFQNIYEVKPGTIYEFSNEKINIKKYFDLENSVKKINQNIQFEHLEELLTQSIKFRYRSNLPINLHFSGGIDSTALLIKIKETFGIDFPVNLFCTKFANTKNQDFYKAKKIANFLNEKLNFKNINIKKIPIDAKKVQYYCDEPYGGVPVISMFQLNKFEKIKNNIVTLEGQGGDELFAGYNSHMLMLLFDLFLKNKNIKLQRKILKYLKVTKRTALLKAHQLINNNFGGSTDLTSVQKSKLKIIKKNTWLNTIEFFNFSRNKIPRTLRFHDRISAANSKELRFPFLDHNYVIHALAMNPELKVLDGYPKYPLREIIKRKLKDKYIFKNKNSQNIPQKKILNENLKYWKKQVMHEIKQDNFSYLKKIFSKKKIKNKNNSFTLWQKINLFIFIKNLKKINAKL